MESTLVDKYLAMFATKVKTYDDPKTRTVGITSKRPTTGLPPVPKPSDRARNPNLGSTPVTSTKRGKATATSPARASRSKGQTRPPQVEGDYRKSNVSRPRSKGGALATIPKKSSKAGVGIGGKIVKGAKETVMKNKRTLAGGAAVGIGLEAIDRLRNRKTKSAIKRIFGG